MVRREDEMQGWMRSAAEHIAQTRRRLKDGREEIDRLQSSVQDMNEHLASMAEWIEATERQLELQRRRPDDDARSEAAA
jgi:predicted RNase H-like nuclease (RuvC/YqgF family)